MTIDTTTPSTEGREAAVPFTVEQPPITALQPDPVNPRPIGAEEWAELLRSIGVELGSSLAVAASVMRVIVLHYSEACSARDRSPGSYVAIEGSSRLLHTADYGTVTWRHKEYLLSPLQAEVVRVLHEQQHKGFREIRGSALLAATNAYSSRLSDLFKGSSAWKALVLPGSRRGWYRLAS